VATGLYLAFANKDFSRYRNYVAVREDLRARTRRPPARS
jgi:hypothetical protein